MQRGGRGVDKRVGMLPCFSVGGHSVHQAVHAPRHPNCSHGMGSIVQRSPGQLSWGAAAAPPPLVAALPSVPSAVCLQHSIPHGCSASGRGPLSALKQPSSSKASDQCGGHPHLDCAGPAAAVKCDLARIRSRLGCGSFKCLLPGFHLPVLHKAGLNGSTAASGMQW